MDRKYRNSISVELDAKVEKLRRREDNILNVFQKTVEDFSISVSFIKKRRGEQYKQLEELSDKRLKTFGKIRDELKIIRLNEKKNEKLSLKLKELEEREREAKSEYNALLSGIYPETGEIEHSRYTAGKRLNSSAIRSSKDELIKRRNDFFEVLKTSFDRLESYLLDMEIRKNEIKKESSEALDKLYRANKQHSEFQRHYTEQIRQIKKLKKTIERTCMEETTIISDYNSFLTSIKSITEIPAEIRMRLVSILSRIDEEKDVYEKEWVVEVENLPASGGKLIEFPRAV